MVVIILYFGIIGQILKISALGKSFKVKGIRLYAQTFKRSNVKRLDYYMEKRLLHFL